jgi:hypothetical protein
MIKTRAQFHYDIWDIAEWLERLTASISQPMRPKASGLVQPGGPPGWLEESDPIGSDIVRDGRSMPPALTEHTICPGLGLILGWAITKCAKTLSWAMSRKEGMAWYSSRPMPSLWSQHPGFDLGYLLHSGIEGGGTWNSGELSTK